MNTMLGVGPKMPVKQIRKMAAPKKLVKGFAAMPKKRALEIQAKGGQSVSAKRGHMAKLGRASAAARKST